MADEAFALSPISARAAMPSEADYDAIREAFMETSRGRWFLSEYAKRNRNADTHMVLDAVARIEHSIAAQKQASGNSLIESLVAIRTIVHDAKTRAAQALAAVDGHATLLAARDGARIIGEIAATLRDCGADVRICDLLDTQLAAIDSGHREIADASHRDAVLASFDQLLLRIGDLAAGEPTAADQPAGAASPPTEPAAAAAQATAESPVDDRPSPAAPIAAVVPDKAADPAETATMDQGGIVDPFDGPEDLFLAPDDVAAPAEAVPAERIEGERGEIEVLDPDAELDFAVLDLVASEMSEPDMAEQDLAEFALEHSDPAPAGLTQAELDMIAAPKLPPQPDRPVRPLVAPVQAAPPAAPVPAPSHSLGAALIAGGLVQRPAPTGPDPLAPIRRLSQAERIAFFS